MRLEALLLLLAVSPRQLQASPGHSPLLKWNWIVLLPLLVPVTWVLLPIRWISWRLNLPILRKTAMTPTATRATRTRTMMMMMMMMTLAHRAQNHQNHQKARPAHLKLLVLLRIQPLTSRCFALLLFLQWRAPRSQLKYACPRQRRQPLDAMSQARQPPSLLRPRMHMES